MKGKVEVYEEIISLSEEDCFLVMQRPKPDFHYPLHTHKEFELNYLENVSGVLRIVDDSVEELEDIDLVLVAGGVKHAYSTHTCTNKDIWETTIQFQASIFDSLIGKRHFHSIRSMFQDASSGIVFSREKILEIQDDLKSLSNDTDDEFDNMLLLVSILKRLSTDKHARRLNPENSLKEYKNPDLDRHDFIMLYLHENYQSHLTLSDMARVMNMSEASLVRFFKKWTGRTFIETLNDIRITESVCRLVDTSDNISEICYRCGFNNVSNFNRAFKKRRGCTPSEYREKYSRSRLRI